MILVTGAGGTVGSELVRQLKAAGTKFRAAFHSEAKAKAARDKGLDAVVVDYQKPDTVREALQGVDKLFLLSNGGTSQTGQENNAVKAAKDAGVEHVVKLSVWEADKEAFSFAKIHGPVEKTIEKSGLKWTFLRPNGFMQNMANYNGSTIKSQNAFYGSIGDAKISLVDVRDIAAVAVKALTVGGHEGKAYLLSGPEALTYREVADKLSKVAGRTVNYVNLPPDQFKQGLVGAGIPAEYADLLIDLEREYASGSLAKVTNDIKQVTGRDAIKFDQYARDNAAAFKTG